MTRKIYSATVLGWVALGEQKRVLGFGPSSAKLSRLQYMYIHVPQKTHMTCGSHDRVTVMCSGLFIPVQNQAKILVAYKTYGSNLLIDIRFPCPYERMFCIYKESVRSLLSLVILEEMERSMVRSATSTTRPPRISGLTFPRESASMSSLRGLRMRAHLVDNLKLLARAGELALRQRRLETLDGLGVQLLFPLSVRTPRAL